MIQLPQLPSLPVRSSNEVGPDGRERFYPEWKCFCCRDSGIVDPHLAKLVVADYNRDRDRLPLCQKSECSAFKKWTGIPFENLDTRFTPSICQELDRIHRSDWHQTRGKLYEQAKQFVKDVTNAKSIRLRDRTTAEEVISQHRHQDVLNGWGVEPYTDEEKEFVAACKKALDNA